jgi:glycosyltransferase 2 family protein
MDQYESNTVADQKSFANPSTWLRLILGLLLGAGALWLVARNVSPEGLRQAIGQARSGPVVLAFALVTLVILAKVWRWRLLYQPPPAVPSFAALWHALLIGQFVNLLAPFRLGEVARVYALYQQTGSSKAQALGTVAVEKSLDLIMLLFTLIILLPLMVVPRFVSDQGPLLATVAAGSLLFLYLLAYQTERVAGRLAQVGRWLPGGLGEKMTRWAVSGLGGLAALRNRRANVALVISSAVIVVLSILTPLAVFRAFDLPYGLPEATLLNLVLSVGMVPPSTPAKVGVFEWLAAFTMKQLGMADEALILSYALVYHAAVVLPSILLGSVAASRTRWWAGPRNAALSHPVAGGAVSDTHRPQS